MTVFINGVNKGNLPTPGTTVTNNKLNIGTNRARDAQFDGWIGEIQAWSHYPYDRYHDKAHRYFMGKWGIDPDLDNSSWQNNGKMVGGAGSGGSIYLKAANLVVNSGVTISANGGAAAPHIDRGGNDQATDGGGSGPAAGGGGRVYLEGTTSFVNHGSATNDNLSANGGQSQADAGQGLPRHGENGTVRVVRPQVSSLVFTSGTLTIDVDSGELTHSDGSFLLGEFTDKTFTATDGTTYSYQITTFTADTINIGSGVVINVVGKNPLSPAHPKPR